MFEITIHSEFSAAHFIKYSETDFFDTEKCEKIHGHNYKVEIRICSKKLNPDGMVLDFRKLKKITNEVVSCLDHQILNDLPFFKDCNPTAENIAFFLYNQISQRIPSNITLYSVTVWETPNSAATYYPT